MDSDNRNIVTSEQLALLEQVLEEAVRQAKICQQKLKSLGLDQAATTNWSSSGLYGAELLTRFLSGFVGAVEATDLNAVTARLLATKPPKDARKALAQLRSEINSQPKQSGERTADRKRTKKRP